MLITFPHKFAPWYMMKNPSDEEQRDGSFRCKCFKCTEPVSGILLKRESLTRCKQGRWARSRQAQLVVYALQQHSVVPGTVHCCCCIMCHTNKITKKKCRVSCSDLQQQQRSSIMMHPSGHPVARRQRRGSHAPIPSRQPRSVCTSTWSLPRARYVSECCVLSLCVTRVENLSSYDHFIQQFIFHRKTVWD